MARKHYTDRERMETVKKFRASGLPVPRYAMENGLAFSTLRDWAYAYESLVDRSVRLNFDESDPSRLMPVEVLNKYLIFRHGRGSLCLPDFVVGGQVGLGDVLEDVIRRASERFVHIAAL